MYRTSFRTFTITSLLVAAASGCTSKNTSDGSAAKPAETAAPAVPATAVATTPVVPSTPAPGAATLPLAIVVPAAAQGFSTGELNAERRDAPTEVAAYKQELTEASSTVVSDDKLADGWAVRYRESDTLVRTVVQRTLGGATWLCRSNGEDQGAHDLGRAACLALSASGSTLVVPFAATTDGASIIAGSVPLKISIAGADSPTTAEAAIGSAKGLKILDRTAVPGGFAVAYQAWNGGIEAQGPMYMAVVRTKLGALDIVCEPLSARSASEATAAVASCKTVRAR